MCFIYHKQFVSSCQSIHHSYSMSTMVCSIAFYYYLYKSSDCFAQRGIA